MFLPWGEKLSYTHTNTHIKYNMTVSTHIITIYGRNALLSCGIRILEVRLSSRMQQ